MKANVRHDYNVRYIYGSNLLFKYADLIAGI